LNWNLEMGVGGVKMNETLVLRVVLWNGKWEGSLGHFGNREHFEFGPIILVCIDWWEHVNDVMEKVNKFFQSLWPKLVLLVWMKEISKCIVIVFIKKKKKMYCNS
jgi:hypothetical protein